MCNTKCVSCTKIKKRCYGVFLKKGVESRNTINEKNHFGTKHWSLVFIFLFYFNQNKQTDPIWSNYLDFDYCEI